MTTINFPLSTPAYRNRNVRRWITGLSLSLLGDQVFFIALAWMAAQITSPAMTGFIVAAGAVPRAALMLFGGVLADRSGPRRTALVSDIVRTLVMMAVAGVLLLGQPSVAWLIILAAIFGVVDALFLPAVGAMPAALVQPHEMTRVAAMRQVVQRGASVAGAPLAGWLISAHQMAIVYAVCAALFAGSVMALLLIRIEPRTTAVQLKNQQETSSAERGLAGKEVKVETGHEQRTIWQDVIEGLRYVRGHSVLLPLLIFTAVAEMGLAGSLNVGLPLLASASGWGATGVGWILGAWGAAAALASLGLAAAGSPRRAGLVGTGCLPVMGAALAFIALAPSLPVAVCAATVLGVGSGIVSPIYGGLVLAAANPSQVGRVVSLSSLASLGGAPLSYAATGFLVQATNASVPFFLGGALTFVTGITALAMRPIRSARTDDKLIADKGKF